MLHVLQKEHPLQQQAYPQAPQAAQQSAQYAPAEYHVLRVFLKFRYYRAPASASIPKCAVH
jgi:hypothetical protein